MNSESLAKDDLNSIINRCTEDPYRLPHEKESAIHLEGDAKTFSITSFKKVVFTKLLRHSEFELDHLTVRDPDGSEYSVESIEQLASDPTLRVIGVTGKLPVGTLSLGIPRKSDSHAMIAK